jgi:hypothetical protein
MIDSVCHLQNFSPIKRVHPDHISSLIYTNPSRRDPYVQSNSFQILTDESFKHYSNIVQTLLIKQYRELKFYLEISRV